MDKGFSHLVEIKDLKLKLLNQVCGMLSSSLVSLSSSWWATLTRVLCGV
jgi:hypothetical protein